MNGFREELLLSLFSCIFASSAHDTIFMFSKDLRKAVTKGTISLLY